VSDCFQAILKKERGKRRAGLVIKSGVGKEPPGVRNWGRLWVGRLNYFPVRDKVPERGFYSHSFLTAYLRNKKKGEGKKKERDRVGKRKRVNTMREGENKEKTTQRRRPAKKGVVKRFLIKEKKALVHTLVGRGLKHSRKRGGHKGKLTHRQGRGLQPVAWLAKKNQHPDGSTQRGEPAGG